MIDGQVTAERVFDEEGGFRNVIKQLFDNGQLSGDDGETGLVMC